VCPARGRVGLRASSVAEGFDWEDGLWVGAFEGLLRASAKFLSVMLATSVASIYRSLGEAVADACLDSMAAVAVAVPALRRAVGCTLTRTFSFCAGSSVFFRSRSCSVATVVAEQVDVDRRSAFTLSMRRRVGSSLVAI
jgi:hypothetical protein